METKSNTFQTDKHIVVDISYLAWYIIAGDGGLHPAAERISKLVFLVHVPNLYHRVNAFLVDLMTIYINFELLFQSTERHFEKTLRFVKNF